MSTNLLIHHLVPNTTSVSVQDGVTRSGFTYNNQKWAKLMKQWFSGHRYQAVEDSCPWEIGNNDRSSEAACPAALREFVSHSQGPGGRGGSGQILWAEHPRMRGDSAGTHKDPGIMPVPIGYTRDLPLLRALGRAHRKLLPKDKGLIWLNEDYCNPV